MPASVYTVVVRDRYRNRPIVFPKKTGSAARASSLRGAQELQG